MGSAKEHYDHHLASFYEWMTGDFDVAEKENRSFFEKYSVVGNKHSTAIDLGCGHGVQTIALANLGFRILAIDFNKSLLEQLRKRTAQYPVTTVEDDLINFSSHITTAEVIVCMGDTLSHLTTLRDVDTLLTKCFAVLEPQGRLVLSFRDYSVELKDESRFIPVKADDSRILTCVLHYDAEFVNVTDLLHEKIAGKWVQKVSTYRKVRLSLPMVERLLAEIGFKITGKEVARGMNYIVAEKGPAPN